MRKHLAAAAVLTVSFAVVLCLPGVARAQGTQQQGPVIIPKKAPAAPVPPPPTPQQQQQALPKPQITFHVEAPDVEIPVTVQTDNGQFVPNLTDKQFQISEDGVPQKIEKINLTNDAPMTVVMLVEFSNADWYEYLNDMLQASYSFTNQLQHQDWVALMTYDLKPTVVVDFTHDKQAIYSGLRSLNFASFSEADEFDALSDTIDRLQGVQGHKVILLISTGFNSFSHITFDQLKKKIQTTQGITIYSVSMAWSLEQWLTGNGYRQQMTQMAILQGNNELRYFATATGGLYFEPRFQGEYSDMFGQIAGSVRSQYTISYIPSNRALDGSTRKVKVELLGPDGKPLVMVDPKGKKVKYHIEYRDTYIARHVVE